MILKVHESACSHQYNWFNPLSLIYNRLYKMIVKSFTIVSQSNTIVKQTATLPSTKKRKRFQNRMHMTNIFPLTRLWSFLWFVEQDKPNIWKIIFLCSDYCLERLFLYVEHQCYKVGLHFIQATLGLKVVPSLSYKGTILP